MARARRRGGRVEGTGGWGLLGGPVSELFGGPGRSGIGFGGTAKVSRAGWALEGGLLDGRDGTGGGWQAGAGQN